MGFYDGAYIVETKFDGYYELYTRDGNHLGSLQIEDVDFHRGMICLPKGFVDVNIEEFEKFMEKFSSNEKLKEFVKYLKRKGITLDDILWLLHDDSYDKYSVYYRIHFGTSYIEFLYPGSPDYGYHVHYIYPNLNGNIFYCTDPECEKDEFVPEDFRYYFEKEFKERIDEYNDEELKYSVERLIGIYYLFMEAVVNAAVDAYDEYTRILEPEYEDDDYSNEDYYSDEDELFADHE